MDTICQRVILLCIAAVFCMMLHGTSVAAGEFGPCGGKPADVYFLLDSSGSIDLDDFQKELLFTQDIVNMFDIGADKVRAGALSFSMTVKPEFSLGEYADKDELLQKIAQIAYEGRGTNTAEALSFLHDKGMSLAEVRPGVPHVAILLTDGMSQNYRATLQQAQLVHDAGITVFVIGIGSQVDKAELEAMGSQPSSVYVTMIDNFDALAHIKEELAVKACEVEAATRAPSLHNMQADVAQELNSVGKCTSRHSLDVTFALDTSAIGATNAAYLLQFIASVSEHINMAAGEVTIATINNGCMGGEFNGETATDPASVATGLATYEAPHFDGLMRTMRLKAADGRSVAKHVAVMFVTYRLSPTEYKKARQEAMRATFQRSAIFAIGIGDFVDESQIKSLTTNGGQYMHAYSFQTLNDVIPTVMKALCLFGAEI